MRVVLPADLKLCLSSMGQGPKTRWSPLNTNAPKSCQHARSQSPRRAFPEPSRFLWQPGFRTVSGPSAGRSGTEARQSSNESRRVALNAGSKLSMMPQHALATVSSPFRNREIEIAQRLRSGKAQKRSPNSVNMRQHTAPRVNQAWKANSKFVLMPSSTLRQSCFRLGCETLRARCWHKRNAKNRGSACRHSRLRDIQMGV